MDKWISVDERVPEIPGAYLVYTHDRRIKIDYCYDFFGNGKLYFEAMVTHWMPLPKPPQMKGGE